MGNNQDNKKPVPDTLDQIRSKEDINLENVYKLGLEHDIENLAPELNNDEKARMYKAGNANKKP